MNKFLPAILAILMSQAALAQKSFSSLEEQMTGKEFQASGLGKLSSEELEALNNWIRSRSLATLDAASAPAAVGIANQTGDERGFENERLRNSDDRPITARLVGTFTGWDGQTIFKLDNGMIWEQADKDKFYVKAVENPTVTIEPGMFRTWRLSVEGYGSDVRVERIQ